MSKNDIKLSYIAALYRVKAEITRKQCLELDKAPEEIFIKAEQKMKSVQENGDIDIYIIYKDNFVNCFESLKSDTSINDFDPISVVLAEGSPMLYEATTSNSDHPKAIAEITIENNIQSIRTWREEWLTFYINHQIRSFNISDLVNPAQIHGIWMKAATGKKIENVPISAIPKNLSPEEIKAKPYTIVANKKRNEIYLVIRDIKIIVESIGIEKILHIVKETSDQMGSDFDCRFNVQIKNIRENILQALKGPEVLGLNLPLTILAATTEPPVRRISPKDQNYPGSGVLKLKISEDYMEAKIINFPENFYEKADFKVDENWLVRETKQFGLDTDLVKSNLRNLLNKIARKQSLESDTVALGIKSRGGTKPFIKTTYLKPGPQSNGEEKIDLREAQQKQIVKPGTLIAKLQYTNDPVIGKDVFGNPLPEAKNDPLKIELGEGVEEKKKGRYYSTCEGVPKIDKKTISVSKMMIHKGDVNLSSGNIIFNGPVVITGSVEAGGVVFASGDLTINGSISKAFVRSGGNIIVNKGITTGEKGLVAAKGDIRAEFVENSKLQCGGSIIATKAILNSDVISGGNIEIKNSKSGGVIGGGQVSCRQNIITGTLGFKHGIQTKLNIGVDWKTELSMRIRSKRIEKLKEAQSKDRQELRELMSRSKSEQKTEKFVKRKTYYQDRLVKERSLLEKMETHLEQAKECLVYDRKVKIYVHETLFANVDVHVGGNLVAVNQEMRGVAILGERKQGTNLVSIELALRMDKEEKAVS